MSDLVAGRYRIVRRIGAGGTAVVFAAADTWSHDAPVALKVSTTSDDAHRGLLARELALLYGLRHRHIPRVVQLGYLGSEHSLVGLGGDRPFLVEELCEGAPAAVWARGRSPQEVAVVGAQIAAALATLHARDVRHGDVKPGNILVSGKDAPHAMLIDFNLAVSGTSGMVPGASGATSGTLRYMAPEALGGRRLPASDVYGLAATLTEMLSGAPPNGHHGTELTAPELGDAISAMSAPDPERRADAATAFELLAARAPENARDSLLELRDSVDIGTGFVGRQGLLDTIDATLERPAAGVSVVRISGAPGVGKTALLTAAVGRAALRGLSVPGSVRSGNAGDIEEVARALYELRGIEPKTGGGSTGDDLGAARWQRYALLAEQLAEATTERPIALVFDDVPIGSPLDELASFLERLGEQGPRLVWLQSGPEDAARPSLPLAPLDVDAVRQIVRIARPLRPVDVEAAEALHEASGGNAGRLVSLLRSYPGERLSRAADSGELPHTDSLRAAVGLLLSNVDSQTIHLATVVALLEPPVPVALLERLPLVGGSLTAARLARAVGTGLLVTRAWQAGTALSVAGEGMREALRTGAGAALARTLATELEQTDPSEERAAELGRLWLAAGEPKEAARHLAVGARHLAARLRLHDALALYDGLLSIRSLDEREREAVAVESARLLATLGRTGEALDRFAAATTHAEARIGRAETLIRLGRYREAVNLLDGVGPPGEDKEAVEALAARAAMLAGDYDGAAARARAAFARATPHPREVELRTVQGFVAFYRGEMENARRLLEQAAEAAPQRDDPLLVDSSRANLALVLHKSGDVPAAERAYAESLAAARAARDLPRQLSRLSNLAALRQDQGRFDDALAGYQEAHTLARLVDGKRELARAALNWANLLCWLGDTGVAVELVEEALDAAHAVQMETEKGYLHLVRAEVALARGDQVAAREDVDAAEEIFGASENHAGLAQTEAVRAELALYRRDAKAARHHADAAAHAAHSAGRMFVEALAQIWRALADLDEPSATPDAAITAAGRAASLAKGLGDPDLGWLAHAAASRLHARTGRAQDARFHLQTARDLAQAARSRLSVRYERTYAALWYRRELWALIQKPEGLPAEQPGRDLDRLLAINRELAQDHDPERLLERIIDAAIALSGAERGFIVLKTEPDSDDLVVRAARNVDQETLETGALSISRSIATEAMTQGVPVTSINALDDERFRELLSVHDLKLRSVLCLPLRAQSGPLGALYLDNRYRVNAFSEADVALLSAFGDQAAIALANARLVTELERRGNELECSRAEIEELNQRLAKELAASSAELELVRSRTAEGGEIETGRFGMVGKSAGMREVYGVIDRVADKDVTVTILGESGTGKELVARAIHAASGRATRAFVSVNCGAIPAELLESELFGHERGAFTGAVRSKPGLFEVAGDGTIFLDEIGDMPLDMQVKLLRVLQQKEYRRVGGIEYRTAAARVLSASNRNLEEMVRAGGFREDLWYRLNVVEIHLPPLRNRREDLPLLVEHLLRAHGGSAPPVVGRNVLASLFDYDWPGNVRELENEIQRAVALSDGEVTREALSGKLTRRMATGSAAADQSLKATVDNFEREAIRTSLGEHGGNVAATARALGLTRAGLYKKINKHGLAGDK